MDNYEAIGRKEIQVLKRNFTCSLLLILKARRVEGKERWWNDCLLWITTSDPFHPKLGEREQRLEMGRWVGRWEQNIYEAKLRMRRKVGKIPFGQLFFPLFLPWKPITLTFLSNPNYFRER